MVDLGEEPAIISAVAAVRDCEKKQADPNAFALDKCAVCGKVIGWGIRAFHLGRCDNHPERPS